MKRRTRRTSGVFIAAGLLFASSGCINEGIEGSIELETSFFSPETGQNRTASELVREATVTELELDEDTSFVGVVDGNQARFFIERDNVIPAYMGTLVCSSESSIGSQSSSIPSFLAVEGFSPSFGANASTAEQVCADLVISRAEVPLLMSVVPARTS